MHRVAGLGRRRMVRDPAPKDRIVSFLETAKPLVTWLDTHVAPTEIVDQR
jgi:hypothetical protein